LSVHLVRSCGSPRELASGDLLGSRFQAYYRDKVGGKCLIDWDQWQDTAGLKFLSGRSLHDHVALKPREPLTLQQMKIVSRVETCAVVCVSVADYLLESTFAKDLENIALIPVYMGRKWSDYDTRTVRLLRCLIGGQPPTEPQTEYKKRPGLLELFLLPNLQDPPTANQMIWKDCTEDFPEVRVLDDLEVVEQLVQMRL